MPYHLRYSRGPYLNGGGTGKGSNNSFVVEKVLNNYGDFVLCAGDFVPSRGVFVPSAGQFVPSFGESVLCFRGFSTLHKGILSP